MSGSRYVLEEPVVEEIRVRGWSPIEHESTIKYQFDVRMKGSYCNSPTVTPTRITELGH